MVEYIEHGKLIEITKYNDMLSSFSADFWLAQKSDYKLKELQNMIDSKNPNLMKDIKLLEELEFNLRHGKVKIVEVK